MAVLGRVLLNNSQRFDLTDAMSMDSYNLGDWKYYIKTLAGNVPYILKGFDIVDAPNRINKDSVTITVEDSIVYFPNSDTAPFFYGLPITSGISDPIEPTLKTNAVNHLYLTLTLAQGVSELKMFWDQYLSGGVGGEYSKMVDTETYVIAEIGSNTVNFPSGSIPIAKVTMDTSVIKSIQDCRPMFFRLGTGGYTPNPLNSYAWKSLPSSIYTRTETPSFINTPGGQNPFQGADKNIYSWKEWMDAMMSKIKEIDGGAFWYQPSTGSISSIFADVLKSTFRSKGTWEHDTSVPGKITWSEDIYITYWGSNLDLTIRAGNESLLDGQLLYIDLQRNKPANILGLRTEWFNGGTYVKGEAPGAFTDTKLGDYIKKDGEPDYYFCKIIGYRTATMVETPIPSLAVYADLQTAYNGSSETLVNAVYNRGIFSTSDLIVKDKNHDDINSAYGNLCWLAYRKDTIEDLLKIESFEVAGTATVISPTHSKIESVAHGLVDGDHIQIDIAAPGTVFVVDSATADSFTIFTDTTPISGAVNFYWATVETKERKVGTPPNDVVVESAEHNFEDGMSIEIKGTLNFDGTYLIKDKTTTTFNIASPVIAPAVENDTGTATMAVMHARSESGVTKVLQGEVRYIGHSDTENIMKFIGQTEPSLIKPEYLVPDDFTGKYGEGNYGDTASADNLTNRAARLSAMMADKAQDKTIVIAQQDITNVTNLSGTLTFTGPVGTTPILNIIIPSSRSTHTVDLSAGLVIGANQVAYVTIDRNQDASSILIPTIEDIKLVPLEENVFILGYRLSTDTVWLWDGTEVEGTGMSVILKSADHLLNDTRFKAIPNSTPDDGILIYPSKRERQGKVLYSYILPNISSKFPRNTGTNEYDGGTYHDQTTLVRFGLAGSTITAEATWPDATSTTVGTFTINDGEWIPVSVFVNADDSLSISYGSAQASLVDAKSDDNIPLGGSSQFKIACVIIHRDGTSIDNIDEDYIIDRRAFGGGGGGGSGDIDREDMIYISLLQNSIYTKTFYDKFDYTGYYVDLISTTATKVMTLDPQDFFSYISYSGTTGQVFVTKNIMASNLTPYSQFYFHVEKDDTLDIWKGLMGTSSRTRAAGTATIKTTIAHGLEVGDVVTIAAVGGGYDAVSQTVTAIPSSNEFSYLNAGVDETVTSATLGTISHIIADYLKAEFSVDGVIWNEIPVYKVISSGTYGFVSFTAALYFRLTWVGTATGNVNSWGLFYNESYTNVGANSSTKVFQSYTLPAAVYTNPYDFSIGTTYTNDGKSLDVYYDGILQKIGTNYEEISNTHVRLLFLPAEGHILTFKENFGPFSSDASVLPAVQALQATVTVLTEKLYANRALYVGLAVWCDYATILGALQNVIAGQEIIVVDSEIIASPIDFTDIDGLGTGVPACGIKFKPGVYLTYNAAVDIATPIIKFNSDIKTENFSIELNPVAGVTIDTGIEFAGSNNNHNGMEVTANDTGNILSAYQIAAGVVCNNVSGLCKQGISTITNVINDLSGTYSNDITILAD